MKFLVGVVTAADLLSSIGYHVYKTKRTQFETPRVIYCRMNYCLAHAKCKHTSVSARPGERHTVRAVGAELIVRGVHSWTRAARAPARQTGGRVVRSPMGGY